MFRKSFGIWIFWGLLVWGIFCPKDANATLGVGIGSGKIQVDELLKSGMSYKLPTFSIINTGNEASFYKVNLSYHEKQPELRPAKDWFDFQPEQFFLEPGQGKNVQVTLNLPLKTEPGKYFIYIEGMPVRNTNSESQVGIAAAAKLYFEIAPTNIFEKLYYKIFAFVSLYQVWFKVGLVVIAVVIGLLLFNKFFKLERKRL